MHNTEWELVQKLGDIFRENSRKVMVVFSMPAAGRLTTQLACRQYYNNGTVIGCFK